MLNYEVEVELYSIGKDKSQKRAEADGYLDIKNRDLFHLNFPASVYPDMTPEAPHLIRFFLNDANLAFCGIDDVNTPGFLWLGDNPGGIMQFGPEGDHCIVVINRHHRPSNLPNHTCGHWYYQLFAKNIHNGNIYGIPWTSCNGSASANPSIKNT